MSAIALVAQLTLPSLASAASAQVEDYTFAFQDADITLVVQEILGQVGMPYTIDPGVTGKISFRIEQRLTRAQLLAALEAVLSANGVALVRNGDQLTVTPQAKAKSSASIRRGVEGAGAAGYEVVAVPLSYAQPTEVARAMEAISAANTVLYANDKLGLLLLGGSGQQLKSAIETLKVFDQNAFQDSKLRWFELTQAQATTVATELDRVVQGAGLVGVTVVPLKRLNGIIVFGRSAETLDEISKWVLKLDVPGKEAASSLWVYHPRNTSAESLSRTLNSVLGVQSRTGQVEPTLTSSPSSSGSGQAASSTSSSVATTFGSGDDEVRIGVDKETNTLLIVAPSPRWIQIQRILNEIDRPQRQILIEASILEVTLSKDFQFGVDWSVLSNDFKISSINNSKGVIGPSYPGVSVTFLNGDISAAVRALGSRTAVEVVSAPKIIALDNRTARLQIGDQVPVVVQSSQSTSSANAALISTVDYRSTGVILTVTPRVMGDDQLVLEVNQEVSSVAKTSTSGIDSPTIQQRRFDSALILNNGGVVALGGLISSNRSVGRSGVPGLKDVPWLGSLFSSQGDNQSRSELIVLLSAKIINDRAGAERVMTDLLADMKELQSRGMLPHQ
ncbi:type II secretion system secretin GspD [Bosea sp. (in: a-proteobacteria)]|uniref:type II secretion system secretin GspD n=1 Tax=Bosea sp. (in: a-proteobacteria) TaxID=1871050 RepID=UPI0025B81308|nr:type II secretion system secretin GspD [Bosea sp. (in: a-proteobacteria)]